MTKETGTPQIRFSGYNDTWEQRKAKDLCSISTGKSNTQDRVDDGIYPFYVRSPIVEHSNRYLFDEEAVLTVGDGVGTGKVFHYVNGKYDLHQRVYRMFGFSEEITAKYFYYYFSNHFYDRVMAMTAKTSVDSVRYEMIADMDITLPKVKEQMAISAYFDRLDHLITLHQRKYDKLVKVKKSMLEKMFPRVGAKVPDIRFYGFNDDWEQRKLKDVIIDAYQGINTTADKVIYSNEGIPVLQAKHITAGSIDFTDVRYLKKEQYNEYFPKYTPQKGDMLFANIGTIGPSTIVENQGEFLIAWNILRIVFNKNLVDAYFVHLIFDKYKDSGYFERMQTGNATKFINKDNIFDINLFMPSEVEQHKIGGYFQKLDHLITLHQRKLEKLKNLKKACLKKMFI